MPGNGDMVFIRSSHCVNHLILYSQSFHILGYFKIHLQLRGHNNLSRHEKNISMHGVTVKTGHVPPCPPYSVARANYCQIGLATLQLTTIL